MSEILYSLATIDGDLIWQGSDPEPTTPNLIHPMLDIINPLYFSAEEALERIGLNLSTLRAKAINLASQVASTEIVAHPTVLESVEGSKSEVSLWYLPDRTLEIKALDDFYTGFLLKLAKYRIPEEIVMPLEPDQDRYCIFVTEVRPTGSRMDIHHDGRKSVIVNLSEPEHRGKTLLGHPDLRKYAGELSLDILMNDPRTIVQRIFPGCGVAFDTTKIPHVGVSDPGQSGFRVILDSDFRVLGQPIDLTVYDSYR